MPSLEDYYVWYIKCAKVYTLLKRCACSICARRQASLLDQCRKTFLLTSADAPPVTFHWEDPMLILTYSELRSLFRFADLSSPEARQALRLLYDEVWWDEHIKLIGLAPRTPGERRDAYKGLYWLRPDQTDFEEIYKCLDARQGIFCFYEGKEPIAECVKTFYSYHRLFKGLKASLGDPIPNYMKSATSIIHSLSLPKMTPVQILNDLDVSMHTYLMQVVKTLPALPGVENEAHFVKVIATDDGRGILRIQIDEAFYDCQGKGSISAAIDLLMALKRSDNHLITKDAWVDMRHSNSRAESTSRTNRDLRNWVKLEYISSIISEDQDHYTLQPWVLFEGFNE